MLDGMTEGDARKALNCYYNVDYLDEDEQDEEFKSMTDDDLDKHYNMGEQLLNYWPEHVSIQSHFGKGGKCMCWLCQFGEEDCDGMCSYCFSESEQDVKPFVEKNFDKVDPILFDLCLNCVKGVEKGHIKFCECCSSPSLTTTGCEDMRTPYHKEFVTHSELMGEFRDRQVKLAQLMDK